MQADDFSPRLKTRWGKIASVERVNISIVFTGYLIEDDR